jgi:hypothetical protein
MEFMSSRKIFYLAGFLYLLLTPLTFHPDIKVIFYQSQFLTKGVFNIYQFFADNPDKAFLGPFVYPPLAYFVYGLIFVPVKILAGKSFTAWLAMGNDAVNASHIFRYLFAMKLPAVLLLFASGHILSELFSGENDKRAALALWFFNPISIYAVAFMGQIDILAVFFTLAVLYYATKRKYLSAVILGSAAAIKTYPLLLIHFLAINRGRSLREKLVLYLVGLAPYVVLIIPFITTPSFFESNLVSGLSQRLFQLEITLGFGESLHIVPIILFYLFILSVGSKYLKPGYLNKFLLAVSAVVIAGSRFHPQWGLWLLPFLVIESVKMMKKEYEQVAVSLILVFIGYLGTVILFDDKFLTWGIISPLDPGILFLPTPYSLVNKLFDASLLQGLFHSLFAAGLLWFVIAAFRKDYE